MTKARDLANLISGGFTEADIPNLSASKITSGQFANSLISASSVSQHAQSFDDNKIVNDISTLGLRVHTQENLNASNTNSASFDVFQDSSAIANLTNVTRNSDEYLSSITNAGTFTAHSNSAISYGTNTNGTQAVSKSDDGIYTAHMYYSATGNDADDNIHHIIDLGSVKSIAQMDLAKIRYNGDARQIRIQYSDASNSGGDQSTVNLTGATCTEISNNGNTALLSNFTSNGLADWAAINTNSKYSAVRVKDFAPFNARYIRFTITDGDWHDNNAAWSETKMYKADITVNATGSFESNAITAASTNKMGAVITYQDHAGTNALNTDIILKLSADNGSNYSTATLTALPDFATGIKMAKVNDLSVTAGTQLKYKIEFANQSASKEARIRGVSLQY